MSIFKAKKSNKGAIIATAIGGAVVAGAALLTTTKKGKAMMKDASDGVTSLLGSAEKLQRTVRKEVKKKAGKLKAKAKGSR